MRMAFFKTWDDGNGFLWIKRLLWTYIGVFIINETLSVWFGGSPLDAVFSLKNGTSLLWQPWRLVSYSFLHGDLLHLLFNLLMWYGLSNFLLQNTLSLKQFFALYASGIIVGGLVWWLIHCNHHPQALVGASAGISALFAYFCLLYPDKSLSILLYFIIPVRIQARWCFIALTVYELYGVLFYELQGLTNIAHSGHLGGILVGWLFIWYRRRPNVFRFRRPNGTGKISYRVHRESCVRNG